MPNIREINQAGLDLVKSFEGINGRRPLDGEPRSLPRPRRHLDHRLGPRHLQGQPAPEGPENRAVASSLYPRGLTEGECEMLLRADLHDACRDV